MVDLNARRLAIQQDARIFVARHIMPRTLEFDRTGTFHDVLLDAAREARILAMAIPPKAKGMSAVILPRNAPGFAIGAADHKLGIRSSSTVELLRDVPVTWAQRLGNEGDGMAIAMKTLDMARPAIAALAVGLA